MTDILRLLEKANGLNSKSLERRCQTKSLESL